MMQLKAKFIKKYKTVKINYQTCYIWTPANYNTQSSSRIS